MTCRRSLYSFLYFSYFYCLKLKGKRREDEEGGVYIVRVGSDEISVNPDIQ